jgi:hypothetical protein
VHKGQELNRPAPPPPPHPDSPLDGTIKKSTAPNKVHNIRLRYIKNIYYEKIFLNQLECDNMSGCYPLLWTYCCCIACSIKAHFFMNSAPFLPNQGMGYSETHGILRKEHIFYRITKTFPSLFRGFFSVRNFQWQP